MGLFLDLRLHPAALGVCFGAGSMVLLYIHLSSIAWFEIGFAVLSALLILHKIASAIRSPFVSMGTLDLFSYFCGHWHWSFDEGAWNLFGCYFS